MRHPKRPDSRRGFAALAVLLFAALTLPLSSARARQYSIGWYKISGGGGTSTNGQYSISGTIGQHDASGPMTGGNYSVTGGFWSLISVVPVPGAPTLSITASGSNVIVSWPSPSSGFVLQQNGDLSTINWVASSFTVTDNGTTRSVTLPSPTGQLFLRLNRP